MRRTAFLILAAAGGLIALVLVAVAIAIATVDVNTFVAPLQAEVKRATGRDLTLQGGVELKLGLEPRLVANGVAFGNAPWGKAPALISAKRVEAQVALLPLLKRRFEIVQLTLVEPSVALETDAAGHGNWEFGAGAAGTSQPAAGMALPPALGVADLQIRDGTLTLRDAATDSLRTVEIESLVVHARRGSSPIDATFKGSVDGVPVALAAQLGPLDDLLARRFPYPVSLNGEVAGKNATLSTKLAQANAATQLNDLAVTFGATSLSGSVAMTRSGNRTHYTVDLSSPTLALGDLPLAAPNPGSAAPPAHTQPAFAIPDTPLPLQRVAALDADGALRVDTLVLREGEKVGNVQMKFSAHDGALDLDVTQARVFGGTVRSHATFAAQGNRSVKLVLEGRDLDLAGLLAAFGTRRDVSGGKTRVSIDVAGRGETPHQWASTMSGSILVVVGAARLPRPKQSPDTGLTQLASAVNPFREVDSSTELKCAVLRLNVSDGVAQVHNSIAAETDKIAASASGTVDFRNETIDLAVRPQIREGINIDFASVANLVRFRGPFRHPEVKVDSVAAAGEVARISAAVATGGWSVLGEALLSPGSPDSPCAVALGRKPTEQSPSTAPVQSPTDITQNIGRAIGKLFGK